MKVIKIGAVWCNGCLVMKPRWKEIEEENPWLETEYYDFDEDSEKITQYNVDESKLPIFIFLNKKEEEIFRLTGEIKKDKLVAVINENKDK